MTRLCTICARGGSRGVPNKNLRILAGQPLISWTIIQARAANCFSHIAVSSDSAEILETAGKTGTDILINRPSELATDEAGKIPVIHHALHEAERLIGRRFEIVVDLDVTSPLRLPADIRGALKVLETEGRTSVVSGTPARRSPYFNLIERGDNGNVQLSKQPKQPILRRQDAPACFDMNASIYVWQRDRFSETPCLFYPDTGLYEMPPQRSQDIDSELDFKIVEILFEEFRTAESSITLLAE